MDELIELKNDLKVLKNKMHCVHLFLTHRLPHQMVLPDFESLIDELKQLSGYVNCMIDYKIKILPEPSDTNN